jgi:hypothetical protein
MVASAESFFFLAIVPPQGINYGWKVYQN